LLASWCA